MRINAESLNPNMTVTEALEEIARVRADRRRETHSMCMQRYRDKHHEELLQKKREYREAHRVELAQKNREYRARKKFQEGGYPGGNIPQEKNILVT
jgi:hypothetical protein